MSTNLNLASKPFSNHALPWILTVIILLVSLVSLLFVLRGTTQANSQAALVQVDINKLKQEEESLVKTAQQVKDSLTPEQVQLLGAAHQLVDRKRFSWSRLLAELESSLPGTVRVSRIAVKDVAPEGTAQLDLVVLAKSPTTITEMISAMDRGAIFHAELRAQNLQKGRGESGTEYELFVVYRPRPSFTTEVAAMQPAKASEETK
jgi:Tfp pilus assembly protein PilN